MKNSGIEWIGEIPDSWEVKRVKDVFSLIGGCGFKDEFQGHLDGDYPFCKASDINGKDKFLDHAQNYVNQNIVDEQHYKVVPKYSILMSKIGEAMKKNHRKINTVPCIVDNNCQALCKKSNDDIIYLYYLFSQIDMIWFDNGGTIPNISNIKLLNFFIPDINEDLQKRIAYHLDEKSGKIDELIANQEKQIEKLKEYKQSVITEAVTKGLDKSAPLKDSGIEWIGEIPAHWIKIKHKVLFKNVSIKGHGDATVLSLYRDYGVVPKDSRDDNHNVTSLDTDSYKYVQPNDLVINKMKAWSGSIAITDYEGIVSPAYYTCKVNYNYVTKRFIHHYLRNKHLVGLYEMYSAGLREGQWDLSIDDFQSIEIAIPPTLEEQDAIAIAIDEKCDSIDKLIAIKQEKIEKLQEYKKSLIYEYVTGKKEVV